jgi:tRNA(Arg) A34 adenosine deaminase TadA
MTAGSLPTRFDVSLPDWLVAELPSLPRELPTPEDRARLVNSLADRNWREGNGGPFAAVVVDAASGEIVSVGVNVVLSSGLSSQHAEVTALGLAQTALGSWDLSGDRDLELVVNWRPCAMCFGAVIWSGVRSVLLSGTGPECEALTGFDEGPLDEGWVAQLADRGIRVREGVLREDAVAVFERFGASDAVVYNAGR